MGTSKEAAGEGSTEKIDGFRVRFETIFKFGCMVLVSAILNAIMMPPGSPWSIYDGGTFKLTILLQLLARQHGRFGYVGSLCNLGALVSYACAEFATIGLRISCNFYGDNMTSESSRKQVFKTFGLISLLIYISSLFLITVGRVEGVRYGVFLLSSVSIVSVATFKLVFKSTAVAMWVLAQSIAVMTFLLRGGGAGLFLEATIAFLPILPAIYALWIRADNIYSHLVKAPSKRDCIYGSETQEILVLEILYKMIAFIFAFVVAVGPLSRLG